MVWIEAKKETCLYYSASFQDWSGDILAAIFTAIASALYFYFKNGMEIDWLNIVVSIAIGFLGFVIFRFLFNALSKAPAKLFRGKENELEKSNCKNVAFNLVPYSMIGYGSGCALRINNNKPIDFGKLRVRAEIKQMYINQKMTLNNRGYSLQYIDKSMGRVEERVMECYFVSPPIERGASIDFVLTKEIEKSPFPIYQFDTYPEKDILWPFNLNESIQPEVVIECEVQGNIEVGDENWALPHIKKYFQVMSSGTILEYQN